MNLQLVYRYILSLSKNENLFTKKKKSKQDKRTKTKKKTKRGGSSGESRTRDHWRVEYTTTAYVKSFAHEILVVDAVWSR